MHSKLRYSLAAGLLAAALTPLSAQSVTTTPVGAMSYDLSAGSTLLGISLLNPSIYNGSIVSVSGNVATLSGGSSNIGSLLVSGKFYYIELTKDSVNSGLYEGDRVDVDTAATISAANGTIVLRNTLENTLSSTLPAEVVGVNLTLREHVTMGSLLASSPGAFIAGDKISLRKDGNTLITATLDSGATTWRSGLTNQNTTIVYPGVGMFFTRVPASNTSMTIVGEVRGNRFVQVLKAGSQMVAEGFPVDSAPAPTNVEVPSRFFTNAAGNTFVGGDKITGYNDSGVLTTYTYNSSTNRWNAGLTNGNVVRFFKGDKATFLTVATENTSYVQPLPY